MRIYTKKIIQAVKCNEAQALQVERYIDQNDMLDWSEASNMIINTISRAVFAKMQREAIVKKAVAAPKAVATPAKPTKKVAKSVAAGTKIAQAIDIYKATLKSNPASSRQDVIGALADGMQIDRKAAAGYYQSCKKKVGA